MKIQLIINNIKMLEGWEHDEIKKAYEEQRKRINTYQKAINIILNIEQDEYLKDTKSVSEGWEKERLEKEYIVQSNKLKDTKNLLTELVKDTDEYL